MRCLNKNKIKFHYATVTDSKTPITDADGNFTGEYTLTYSAPVEMEAFIAPSSGDIRLTRYGLAPDYGKQIITEDTDCPIDTGTVFWVGKDPTTEPYNYVLYEVSKYPTNISYRIREVSSSGVIESEPDSTP